jgi:hypothetical protein
MGSKAMSVTDQVLNWVPVGKDQHVTVSNTALAITPNSSRSQFVQLNVQGADVRVALDGDNPVGGSVGALWKDGSFVYWNLKLLAIAKFIRDGATDAVVHVQEFEV